MTIGNKICNTCTRLKLCEGEEKNEEVDSNQKGLSPLPIGGRYKSKNSLSRFLKIK